MNFKHLLLLILVYSSLSCSKQELELIPDENHNKYYSDDYYDFESIEIINDLGVFTLTPFENEILFSDEHGWLDSPLTYANDLNDFNFNGLYLAEESNGEKFYFRFGSAEFKNLGTVFGSVNWINREPKFGEKKIFNISTVKINFIQHGVVDICMIGDSQTWQSHSQNLRRYMNFYFEDFNFVGSNTDIFGYPHEGEGGDETLNVLDRFQYIPKADFYTILLGTNDYVHGRSIDATVDNIFLIFDKINEKYPDSVIIFISPFPSLDEEVNEFNEILKHNVLNRTNENSKIKFFDLQKKILENENWAASYFVDKFHLNDLGVDLFAKTLSEYVKDYINTL